MFSVTVILSYIAKPVITDITGPESVIVGQRLELTCITDGIPTPTVSWVKNGIFLSNASVIINPGKKGSLVLTIVSATVNDSGMYTCFASNPAATVNSTKLIEIFIETTVPENLEMIQGRLVNLYILILL